MLIVSLSNTLSGSDDGNEQLRSVRSNHMYLNEAVRANCRISNTYCYLLHVSQMYLS